MICQQCGIKEAMTDEEICEPCEKQNEMDTERIDELIESGHPEHCAIRQVWGDGECECDFYKKGYDPYGWKKILSHPDAMNLILKE